MRQNYFKFDQYIICKMLNIEWETAMVRDFSQEERYDAYRICLKKINKNKVVATQTLKKWFGFRGLSQPNRENIIELGFALQYSDSEVREMLVKGAHEPDIQVNDYREMIFLYGLKHGISYTECLDMIEQFEQELPSNLVLRQHNRTSEMWKNYDQNCRLNKDDFLQWMLSQADYFKGYSLTILEYFEELKREILIEAREDAAIRLEELLAESGFLRWEKKRHWEKKKREETIPLWLKKTKDISDNLANTIRELLKMSLISEASNAQLLSELYGGAGKTYWRPNTRRSRGEIYLMDGKYLSDLLNVSMNKEKLMKQILESKQQGENMKQQMTVSIRDQKRRCHLLGRSDLLPLILCVSQRRYMRRLEAEEYDCRLAKNMFINLADHILASCQMVLLDEERYELDALLCSCYAEEEMYSYADILEYFFAEK